MVKQDRVWNFDTWLDCTLRTWEKRPTIGWLWSAFWIIGITGIAFLWHLGSFGLVDETEPLFAEAARQMVVTGDWVTPYFNGETRFDKPPLIYWLMAIAYKLLGVNEWSVRLPSALAAIALISLTVYVLRYYGFPGSSAAARVQGNDPYGPLHSRWLTAWLAAGCMAFSGEMLAWGRTGVSDMLLNGCLGTSLLAFFMGYVTPEPELPVLAHPQGLGLRWPTLKARWYLAFYLLISLGILTKGPIGIVLPTLIISLFLLYVGQFWTVIREMRPLRGLIIILTLSLPWYYLVIAANGEAYIRSFFGYHNFERFTRVVNNHAAPWYFYFIVILVGFAPWSIYLPLAFTRLRFWQVQQWRKTPRSQHLGIFAFCWFVAIFGFFTIAVTKLPSYVLPLMPAAAILVALLWSDQQVQVWHRSTTKRSTTGINGYDRGLRICGWINVLFLTVLTLACFASPLWVHQIHDPAMPDLPQALHDSRLVIQGGVILLVMTLTIVFLLLRNHLQWLWSINLLGFAALLTLTLIPILFVLDEHRQLPLREIAETAVEMRYPQEELIMMGFEKPSIVFYSHQPVFFLRRYHSTLRHIYSESLLKPLPDTLLLLTYPRRFPALGLEPQNYQSLRRSGAYELIRVKKAVFELKPAKVSP